MTATAPPAPTQTAPIEDPFEAADKATWDPTFSVFGQVQVETFFCVLQKKDEAAGIKGGKVEFDPNTHDIGSRLTAIKIAIIPAIPGRGNTDRELIAESAEWTKIVNPSIKALGPAWNLKGLHNQWVEAALVPTGRKYKGADGAERDATTIKFVRVFQSEDACLAAAQTRGGPAAAPSGSSAPAAAAAPTGPNDAEKGTAKKFLPALWRSAGGDIAKFDELIQKNPLTAKYFTIDSPEVLEVVAPAEAAGEPKLPF